MSPTDVLAFALRALASSRRRTLLSLLGMAVGVAAVLVLVALGEGARRYVRGQFASLGANLLVVLPGHTDTSGGMPGFGGTPNDLTLGDAEALRRGLSSVYAVAPVTVDNETLAHADRSRRVVVMGSTASIQPLRDMHLRAGRFLPDLPWERGAPVVVIGARVARELFAGQNPLGKAVRLGGWRLRVIGLLQPQGTHMGIDMDDVVVVPVATAMAMFDRTSLFRIVLGVRAYADLDRVKQRAHGILMQRHGEEDFTLITQDAVLASLGTILSILTLALAGIAGISLSVAGIGIMNVMLVAVSERTSEVGLLAAIGALRHQILALFLCEAALLGLAGGLAGWGGGILAVRLLRRLWPVFPAATPTWAILAALGVAMGVGTLFGWIPARRATRLDPVLALGGRTS